LLDACGQSLRAKISYGDATLVNFNITNLSSQEQCTALSDTCKQCLSFASAPIIEPTYVQACPRTVGLKKTDDMIDVVLLRVSSHTLHRLLDAKSVRFQL
jgi:hypothetical protein